jgi:hypothetical protein
LRTDDIMKRQIHTVLLVGGKQQGVALGNDGETGHAIRIWLMTPKAVDLAQEQLAAFANSFGSGHLVQAAAQPERSRRLNVSQAKSWSLR